MEKEAEEERDRTANAFYGGHWEKDANGAFKEGYDMGYRVGRDAVKAEIEPYMPYIEGRKAVDAALVADDSLTPPAP